MKLFRQLFLIALVAAATYYVYMNYGGEKLLAQKSPALKKQTDNVLGAATGIFNKGASASANLVSNMVLKTATDPLMKEYSKLKPEQKEILKKQICK